MATAAQTTNFVYAYNDSLLGTDRTEAIARANALAASCEADLTPLQGWFNLTSPEDLVRQTTLTVLPSVVAGTLKSLTLFPDHVTGGQSTTGTVTLEDAVPTDTLVGPAAVESGGTPVGPQSSVVRVPSSIAIPAGKATGSFRIQSSVLSPPDRD